MIGRRCQHSLQNLRSAPVDIAIPLLAKFIAMVAHKLPSDLSKGFDAAYLLSLIVDTPDWQTALSAGSLLEAMLEAAIAVHFDRALSNTDREEIFSGYGPLATFSGKIAIAHAMVLISKESRHDLQQIKAIRNDAAHRTNGFQFGVANRNTLQQIDIRA